MCVCIYPIRKRKLHHIEFNRNESKKIRRKPINKTNVSTVDEKERATKMRWKGY